MPGLVSPMMEELRGFLECFVSNCYVIWNVSSSLCRILSPHQTGDFLISVDDINLDKPPIWRIDGKFLIQKYEPIKGNGQRLYKNMATVSQLLQHETKR